jgi:hypothetical protein
MVIPLVLFAYTPGARSDVNEFEKSGLGGEWAADCDKPASIANPHVIWESTSDGGVRLITKGSNSYSTVDEIKSFSTLPGNRVHYVIKVGPPDFKQDFDVILILEANRYRAWSTHLTAQEWEKVIPEQRKVLEQLNIRDGKGPTLNPATGANVKGEETRWAYRCNKAS